MRERLSFDRGWYFHLGDIPFPKLISHSDCYNAAKASRATGAAAPGYDDTGWTVVNLPHDWASESPFVEEESLSQGFRPRGIGWYRRHFKLDPSDKGKHLELQFDGVSTHCTVWLNGNVVHRNWCGYTGWNIDLTPFAKYGDELNTVAVRVDAEAMEGWWYEGAGIYRHTWLIKRAAVHLVTDGVYANPIQSVEGVWWLPVEATVANCGYSSEAVQITASLLDFEGKVIGVVRETIKIEPLQEATAKVALFAASPRLWSVDHPVLYRVRTEVWSNGRLVDATETNCGFRTVRFDSHKGFFLNGVPLKLQGVCNHQDHAGVGVAIPDSLWEWRLRQLKNLGVNAYRVAHNPPAKEFLDLCDRMGILVMDENRHFNSSPEYVRQLEWLVRRDRNHPSVILWSVFNEEPMQGTEVGFEMVRRMVAIVKRLDSTRPVTAAMNGGLFSPINVSQTVDVVGFNYQIESYDRFHEVNPCLPLTSSEDVSAFMTRGAYETVVEKNIRGSYDTEFAPWGASHRDAWRAIAERDYLAGGFVWTGFDYHGEPTPHAWPSCSSFFGMLDLCGFPKVAAYIHRAHWVKDQTVLEIAPHWNWPGREGALVKVMVITNACKVSLWLNGIALGEKSVEGFDFPTWEVSYIPGRLEAVALGEHGAKLARAVVETTGEPVSLELLPDRMELAGDGCDAQPVTVRALDAKGHPVPTANFPVTFQIEGPGSIIGLGNGDPNSHESEKGNSRSLFNGLAQVILQSQPDAQGTLFLTASSPGLKTGELRLPIVLVAPVPSFASTAPVLYLQAWRMSPLSDERIDPNLEVADNDMNSWPNVQPGELQSFAEGSFAVYRVKFRPFASIQNGGGRIVFRELTGKVELWLDGMILAKRESLEADSMTVVIPPRVGDRMLSILIETPVGTPAGLSGQVFVESGRG